MLERVGDVIRLKLDVPVFAAKQEVLLGAARLEPLVQRSAEPEPRDGCDFIGGALLGGLQVCADQIGGADQNQAAELTAPTTMAILVVILRSVTKLIRPRNSDAVVVVIMEALG